MIVGCGAQEKLNGAIDLLRHCLLEGIQHLGFIAIRQASVAFGHAGFFKRESVTALDFLGFGLPVGSASLGELLNQGKANLHAPWLGFSAFAIVAIMLSLLVFIGEAVRDAFDPRKTFR